MPPARENERQVIAHIEVWSVAKLSFLFFLVCGIIWVAAGVILWNVIASFGWIDKIESLIGSLASGSYKLSSGSVLKGGLMISGVFVVGFTLAATLLAVIYNLMSDVIGGIRVRTEDRAAKPARRTRRRAPAAVVTRRRRPAAASDGKRAQPSRTGTRKPAATGARPKPASGRDAASRTAAKKSAPQRPSGAAASNTKGEPARTRTSRPKPARTARATSQDTSSDGQRSGKAPKRESGDVAPVPRKTTKRQ